MSHSDYSDDCSDHYCDVQKEVRLDSPRLREACKRQGIEPYELVKKSISDVREIYQGEKLNKAGLTLATQHYEERRQEKLRIVLKERSRIIDHEEEWAHVPSNNKKRPDLFSSKGRTTVYAPKDLEAKRRKERTRVGEMLIDQQAEMDEFMRNNDDMNTYDVDYKRRLAYHKASEAKMEIKRDSGIEVIDSNEFEYDHLGKRGIMLLKKKTKTQSLTAKDRRNKQQGIYKREINQFNRVQQQIMEKKVRTKNPFGLSAKNEGYLLENRVIFNQRSTREKMNPEQKAMKDYLQEQLKLKEEEYKNQLRDKETVIALAKKESKKWLDSKASDIKRGMVAYEEREKEFGPSFRKALKKAYEQPEMYTRLIQKSLFEKELPEKRKSVPYSCHESDSDNELDIGAPYTSEAPLGSITWMKHHGNDPRVLRDGRTYQSLYKICGWHSPNKEGGSKSGHDGGHMSISSKFVRNAGEGHVSTRKQSTHRNSCEGELSERRRPVKYNYNESDSSDTECEEGYAYGSESPLGSVGWTTNGWNKSQVDQDGRTYKSLYKICGWNSPNKEGRSTKSGMKSGYSTISSEFVKNAGKHKHYESPGKMSTQSGFNRKSNGRGDEYDEEGYPYESKKEQRYREKVMEIQAMDGRIKGTNLAGSEHGDYDDLDF